MLCGTLGCLSAKNGSKKKNGDLDKSKFVAVYPSIILVTLPVQSVMTTMENYRSCLGKLFSHLKDDFEQNMKPIVLNIQPATTSDEFWFEVIAFLSDNIAVFEKITYLDFTESLFSLKQLRDFYPLFKKCQKANIPFPFLDIHLSQAASQLIEKKNERKKELRKFSLEELAALSREEARKFINEDIESVEDISKQDFLEAISNKKGVDKIFLQCIKWLENESLYDAWKKELYLE